MAEHEKSLIKSPHHLARFEPKARKELVVRALNALQKLMNNMEVDGQKQRLKDFLRNELNWTEKRIVVFYYYEELTMREIAKVLKQPEIKISQMHSSIIARCKAYVHKKQ